MTTLVDVPGTVRTDVPVHRRRPAWLRSPKVMIGLALLGFFAIVAFIGPYIAPSDPSATGGDALSGPSPAHWLGTTSVGEDVLSQLLAGTRLSLQVGFTAAVIAEVLAILVGITGAYLGGVADEALSLGTNIFLVIPVLPLQILILTYLGATSWFMIALVIALTAWPHSARKLRAQTLSIRSRDYVQAARAAGEPGWRIVLYEILPNEIAIIATGFLFTVLAGVIVQTSLAFLGLGGTSQWSWGAMLHWSESENAFLLGGDEGPHRPRSDLASRNLCRRGHRAHRPRPAGRLSQPGRRCPRRAQCQPVVAARRGARHRRRVRIGEVDIGIRDHPAAPGTRRDHGGRREVLASSAARWEA